MACNLYLIQCPASCAFDLKVVNPTHTGKESITFSATNVSKHLQSLKFSARLRPARASSEGLGWLAGYICDLASPLGVTAPSGVALSFSRRTNDKAPTSSGLLLFCGHKKTGAMAGF